MAKSVESIDSIMETMNRELKGKVIQKGVRNAGDYDYKRIPFTSPRLNHITYGGLPQGKLIEFYGEKGGGKTTTALDIVANYQHMDDAKSVLYIDAENTLDTVWANKLGVDTDELLLFTPEEPCAETIFKYATQLMQTGEIGLVIVDSLGVLMSNKAFEGTTEDKTFGGISMALTDFSKRAVGLCNKHQCTLIGINQEREVIGSMYGAKKTTGGNAWQYNVAVRLDFNKGHFFDNKYAKATNTIENPFGNIVQVAMTKNKTCPPNRRTGFYTLRYDIGIDYLYDLVDMCVTKYGIIDKDGSWYTLMNPETGDKIKKLQGISQVTEYLSDEANLATLKMYEDYFESKIKED